MYSSQMNLFNEGGLKDEGGMVDEVSGNEVPVGSTRKEVRDDVPAMLSEGEFVFPADVVRYIGLEELMQMRQEAKMGLKRMEAMGQMGNSEEATMPDDMPFTEADIIIMAGEPEEKREMNRGGVIHAQNGTYVQPSMFASQPPINPYQYAPPASAFSPTGYVPQQNMQQQTQTSGYRPRFVEQGVQRKVPISMSKDFVEDIFTDVKYINPETGDIITLRLNSMGVPIDRPAIPEGYIPYTEYLAGETGEPTTPEEETPAATPQPQRDDDGPPTTPPPEPFNWDEASPEAIVNEVQKINSGVSTIFTGVAFALNPLFGALASTMMKANQKSTLSKLNEKLKDPAFVAEMKKAGQLDALKEELTKLEEKADKGILSGSILGVLGEVMTSVGDALGLSDEQKKTATSNTIAAETTEGEVQVDEKGEVTNKEPILTTDEGFASGKTTLTGVKIPENYRQELQDRLAASQLNMTVEEYRAQKGVGSLDAAVAYSQGLGETVTPKSAEDIRKQEDAIASLQGISTEYLGGDGRIRADAITAELAANILKTLGVNAENITKEDFDKVVKSGYAKKLLGIDPFVTNYSEFKRLREQTTTPTTEQTITDDETGEVLEVGVESATVRDDTAEALGTEPVDVTTMTSDELAEVIFGLTDQDLLTYTELVNSGVSTKAALDFYVNGNTVGLAQDIYDKNIGSVLKDIDKGTASKIEMIFANKQIQYKDDDDGPTTPTFVTTTTPPTATNIQNYLDQVAGEDTSADVGMTTLDEVAGEQYNRIDRLMNKTEELDPKLDAEMKATEALYDPTKSLTTEQAEALLPPVVETPTPNVTYAQPSQDPYAEAGRPTGGGQPSNDNDSDETNVGAPTGSSGGSGSLVTGGPSAPAPSWTPPGFNFGRGGGGRAKGGLIEKPKKKKATSKKRGMAARK